MSHKMQTAALIAATVADLPGSRPILQSLGKKHVGITRVSVDEIRKVLGLGSVKDADGNLIREAPLSLWANFRQRALDLAIGEIKKKTDLNVELESIERAKHRRVTGLVFSIKAQSTPVNFRSNL